MFKYTDFVQVKSKSYPQSNEEIVLARYFIRIRCFRYSLYKQGNSLPLMTCADIPVNYSDDFKPDVLTGK